MPLHTVAVASKSWIAAQMGITAAARAITSSSAVKRRGIFRRKTAIPAAESKPTAQAPAREAVAATWAASGREAPRRFAIRVLAAMEMEKGKDQVMSMRLAMMDWAARVRISKADSSAITMTRPGMASRIIGPQRRKASGVKPPQHWRPWMRRT